MSAVIDRFLSDPSSKLLIDESTVGAVKTTYIGRSEWLPSASALTSVATRQIMKYEETTTWADVDTEFFLPLSLVTWLTSSNFEFIRDNRAVLTYV